MSNVFSVTLKNGEVIFFDIIAIRDLLNDAFPPEVYRNDRVCRASQKKS